MYNQLKIKMRMKKNKTIFKSKDIINTRDNISKKISSYWKTIEATNLMSNKAVAAGMRKYDLKALYNEITQLAIHRVKSKLLLNAINSGIKKFSFNGIEKTHYYKIYMLNELQEQKVHMMIVNLKHTINPTIKSKAGKKGIGKNEVFTNAKTSAIINDLSIKIEALKADIQKFNDNAEIEIDLNDDTFSLNMAA